MCSTRTEDSAATVSNSGFGKKGCEVVRIAVPNFEAAGKFHSKKQIKIPLGRYSF